MLSLVLSSCLSLAVTGVAAASGDECPATALIAKWEKATERLGAMSAPTREVVAGARKTANASCPVCQETPATFALIGRFLDSTVALDGRVRDVADRLARAQGRDSTPAEIRAAFEQRLAIGSRASELYAAFSRGMAAVDRAPGSPECSQCSRTAADPSAAEFASIDAEARRLLARWHGVPARAASLSAESKAELFAVMEVFQREAPVCDLVRETMSVLANGLERLVPLDATLHEHCEATSKQRKDTPPAELAQLKKAVEARTRATASVVELLRVMLKTMTPEIFEATPATVATRSGK